MAAVQGLASAPACTCTAQQALRLSVFVLHLSAADLRLCATDLAHLQIQVKLKPENCDIAYPPIIQSGGKYDLKVRVCNDAWTMHGLGPVVLRKPLARTRALPFLCVRASPSRALGPHSCRPFSACAPLFPGRLSRMLTSLLLTPCPVSWRRCSHQSEAELKATASLGLRCTALPVLPAVRRKTGVAGVRLRAHARTHLCTWVRASGMFARGAREEGWFWW